MGTLSVKIHTTYLLQMASERVGNHKGKQQDYTRNYSMQQNVVHRTVAVSVTVHRYTVSDTNFTWHSAGYLSI